MIIAGANATDDPARLLLLGARLGWPILADPRSRCRVPGTIAAADAIVRAPGRPDLPSTVVLLGAPWLSKALGDYVAQAAAHGARVISVDPWWQWTDPTVVVERIPPCPGGQLDRGGVGPGHHVHREFHRPRMAREVAGARELPPNQPSIRRSGKSSANHSWPGSRLVTRQRTTPSSWCRPPCPCGISNGSPRRSRHPRP